MAMFLDFPVPKRRRTISRQIPNSRLFSEWPQDDSSGPDGDEAEALGALGMLAEAALGEAESEGQEGESGAFEATADTDYRANRSRDIGSRHRKLGPDLSEENHKDYGKLGPSKPGLPDTATSLPLNEVNHLRNAAAFGLGHFSGRLPNDPGFSGYPAKLTNFQSTTVPNLQDPTASGGVLPIVKTDLSPTELNKLRPKRCARHVFIARYIEHQSLHNEPMFAAQRVGSIASAQNNPDSERDVGEQYSNANGTGFKPNITTLPETSANIMQQDLVPVSLAHSYMGQSPYTNNPTISGLPNAYASILNQQQPNFPFLSPNMSMPGPNAQQQALAAQAALAGFPSSFSAQLLGGYPFSSALSSQLATVTSNPNGSANLPAMSLPPVRTQGPQDLLPRAGVSHPPNGLSLKKEDHGLPFNMGMSESALGPADLERLKKVLPQGFFDQRNSLLATQTALQGFRKQSMMDQAHVEPLSSSGHGKL